MDKNPNIVLIMTDQQSALAIGYIGNEDLHTPAMDSLAADGVVFTNAYCAYPLCGPSRACIFSGFTPHRVGVMKNGDGIDEKYRPYEMGNVFSKAGYECVYGGKWHVPKIEFDDVSAREHGFEVICGRDDANLAQRCIEFINREHNKPFLMVASFENPHNICQWAREQDLPWGGVMEKPINECPDLPPNFAIPPYEPQAIREYTRKFPRFYSSPEYTDPDWWRRYRDAYYRIIEKVDAEIGKVLDELKKKGLFDDALIIFTSDHGDNMGSHQLKQKSIPYEEAAKVPLVICHKSRLAHRVVHYPVSNGIDMLPTMCSLAGIDPGVEYEGLDITSPKAGERAFVVTEMYGDGDSSVSARMVRTARYKYIVYNWGRYREQLFDLEKDPGEMVNLAYSMKYGKQLDAHREYLAKWCAYTGDSFTKKPSRTH
jgi:arylsulfatase A-like enzyme